MENKTLSIEKSERKSFSYRFGMVLLILAVVCWIIALIVPFTPFTIGIKTVVVTISIIIGEILFWVGAVLVGKEVVTKYKHYLNPKNWWRKNKGLKHEKQPDNETN